MNAIEQAVAALRAGEVVALPTESSYGLAVDARSEPALARLFALKAREAGKPPPLLVASEEMARTLAVRVPERARALIDRFWPGPLTLVLPANDGLPEAIVSQGGVGMRRSPHPIADGLVRAFGGPITATSCNLAGQPPAFTADEARAIFGGAVKILEGDAGRGAPSTVVRISDDGALTVLRAGAIDPATLL